MVSASKPTVALPRRSYVGSEGRRTPRARPATLTPGQKLGAWKVEQELGRGGMGAVYAVTHRGFGKRAALKLCHASVLSAQYTPETFLREARVVHLVNHPGVCDVFSTGSYDHRPYLAMERLVGITLGDHLDRSALSHAEAIEVLVELCEVLASAHAAGVVHRDLKLDNVFLLDKPTPAGRRVKLLDWGVARIVGEADPMVGMIAGTLTYMAPEQARGEDITPAADVYSLAVLAYQLLLGGAPFRSPDDREIIDQHLTAEPPRPTSRWAEIPPALDAVLVAMLAKLSSDRPTITSVLGVLRACRATSASASIDTVSIFEHLRALPKVPAVDAFGRPAPVYAVARTNLVRASVAIVAVLASVMSLLGG